MRKYPIDKEVMAVMFGADTEERLEGIYNYFLEMELLLQNRFTSDYLIKNGVSHEDWVIYLGFDSSNLGPDIRSKIDNLISKPEYIQGITDIADSIYGALYEKAFSESDEQEKEFIQSHLDLLRSQNALLQSELELTVKSLMLLQQEIPDLEQKVAQGQLDISKSPELAQKIIAQREALHHTEQTSQSMNLEPIGDQAPAEQGNLIDNSSQSVATPDAALPVEQNL